jgi:hypothetical protein
MISRNLVLAGWFSLLGAAVFWVEYRGGSLLVTAVLAGLVASSVPLANRLENWYDQRAERKKLIAKYRSNASRFASRVRELGLGDVNEDKVVDKARSGNFDPTKSSVYRAGIELLASEEPEYRKNILFVIVLCREIKAIDDAIERSRLKAEIDRLTTDFDYLNPDEPTAEFLGAFETAQEAIDHGNGETAYLFENSPTDTRRVALEFIMDYGTTDELSLLLFDDREQSRELRRTLGKLIARGRLSTESVSKETAKQIQSELDELGSSTKFLLFSQLLHREDEVAEAIEKFPHFQIGKKYPESGFPEAIKYMRIYVVYPEFDYGSATHFMESEIKSAIPEEYPEDGFIAAMPLELSELEIFPEHVEFESYLEGTYDTLTFLKTGSGQDLSEIVSDTVISEVEISELLATLPFNVIDPEIREEEKEVIIDNYEILKQEFGVRELFDWGDVDPERLGNKLAELDDDGNTERWQEVAEQIVEKVSEYDSATYADTKSDEIVSG